MTASKILGFVVVLACAGLMHAFVLDHSETLAQRMAPVAFTPPSDEELLRHVKADAPEFTRNVSDGELLAWIQSDHRPEPVHDYHSLQRSRQIRIVSLSAHGEYLRQHEEYESRYVKPKRERLEWAVNIVFALTYVVLSLLAIRTMFSWVKKRALPGLREAADQWQANRLRTGQLMSKRRMKRQEDEFFRAKALHENGLLSLAEFERKKAELRQAIEDAGLGDRPR